MFLYFVYNIGSFIIYLWWRQQREEKKKNLEILRTVTTNEQSVLLSYKHLPSWVCFPDIERAEWINQIICQMWPFISDMVSDILKNQVEPEIKKSLPSLLKSFKFVEVDLGNQPLKIGGVRVYTEHVRPTEIILDAEIVYAGDAVVKVGIDPGITAGISDLQIRGNLRVEFSPLLSKSPLVGGLTCYFLEQPEFDMDLTNLLNVFDFPGLSDMMKRAIGEVIDSFIVLPNRIKVPIGDTKDLESLKFPMPLGVLHIGILGASNLIATDKNVFKKNSSDPYIKCKVGKFKYCTKKLKNTLSPTWKNENFKLFVNSLVGSKLELTVYDQDKIKDDTIGNCELQLVKVAHSSYMDQILPLTNVKSGSVHLECGWFDFSEDLKDLPKKDARMKSCCLFIKLDHARNLPVINMDKGTCSAFVEIVVGAETVKSKTQRNTKKPVWEEIFSFFVDNLEHDKVKIKIMEENRDEALGSVEYSINKLISLPNMKIHEDFHLQDCFTEAKLNLTFELKALVAPVACD